MTGNNINLNAQNPLLNQSGDIQATNNLDLKAKTIANIASEQTITKVLMVMFCALKNAWGVLLKSSSVAPAK
jgi:hypothetical protein